MGPPSHAVELGFEVDDIAAMMAHPSARGLRDYREESMGWGEAIELRDIDGHRIVIDSFNEADEPAGR